MTVSSRPFAVQSKYRTVHREDPATEKGAACSDRHFCALHLTNLKGFGSMEALFQDCLDSFS
jgi:hypothetical protein